MRTDAAIRHALADYRARDFGITFFLPIFSVYICFPACYKRLYCKGHWELQSSVLEVYYQSGTHQVFKFVDLLSLFSDLKFLPFLCPPAIYSALTDCLIPSVAEFWSWAVFLCFLWQIPCTYDLLATSGMQLALLVQPLALPHPSEEPIQVMPGFPFFLTFYCIFCSAWLCFLLWGLFTFLLY